MTESRTRQTGAFTGGQVLEKLKVTEDSDLNTANIRKYGPLLFTTNMCVCVCVLAGVVFDGIK
jgi:hypothetical protein